MCSDLPLHPLEAINIIIYLLTTIVSFLDLFIRRCDVNNFFLRFIIYALIISFQSVFSSLDPYIKWLGHKKLSLAFVVRNIYIKYMVTFFIFKL